MSQTRVSDENRTHNPHANILAHYYWKFISKTKTIVQKFGCQKKSSSRMNVFFILVETLISKIALFEGQKGHMWP